VIDAKKLTTKREAEMIIGKFDVDDEGDYTGELNALGLKIEDISICPVKDKRADGANFVVIGYGEFPDISEIDFTRHCFISSAMALANRSGSRDG
jgi:hypothetical protein